MCARACVRACVRACARGERESARESECEIDRQTDRQTDRQIKQWVKDESGGRKVQGNKSVGDTYVPGGTSPIKFSAAMIPDACQV